jgi:hypothetical protein
MPEESMKALVKIQRFAKKVIIRKENEDDENWKVSCLDDKSIKWM